MYVLHLSLSVAIPAIQPRLRLSGTNRLRSTFHSGQRLLPIHGGDKIFLSGSQLPVNLPQARYDGHGSINITFLGQKIRFHKDA
ncbi:MAG: hypothetical protein KZQ66_09685 [Candidatus Thiodiazotropha sp. (ex Lucinoma aequizonata)]|nr:hypothetical protein [Candidatus Thiodiazotropha sp. (ex Lucinoma aequizonata)]MCU7898300.1 hypothetical protein [Candidatus Thiodiazotropha sp. (ex Lucinoma aequizonata)]MCU7902227.1 hypothetical protein [Candidatus Thiodiazotropha sp. (ex Lucinoma aequizonata)]MCU7908988.1 hypothetical protein [Candidatus Thiodiazotropha sp. (ex Lucinoma aequizonata)]